VLSSVKFNAARAGDRSSGQEHHWRRRSLYNELAKFRIGGFWLSIARKCRVLVQIAREPSLSSLLVVYASNAIVPEWELKQVIFTNSELNSGRFELTWRAITSSPR